MDIRLSHPSFHLTRIPCTRKMSPCTMQHAPCNRPPHDHPPQTKVRMAACNQKNQNQRWELTPLGRIRHLASDTCLDMGEGEAGQVGDNSLFEQKI